MWITLGVTLITPYSQSIYLNLFAGRRGLSTLAATKSSDSQNSYSVSQRLAAGSSKLTERWVSGLRFVFDNNLYL